MHSALARPRCEVTMRSGHVVGHDRARDHGARPAQAKQLAWSAVLCKRNGVSASSGTELHHAARRSTAAGKSTVSTRVTGDEVPELTQVRLNNACTLSVPPHSPASDERYFRAEWSGRSV